MKRIIGFIIMAFFLFQIGSCFVGFRNIKINGDNIIIDAKKHHLEGKLKNSKKTVFLFKDLGMSLNPEYYDALMVVMPLEKAEELSKKYGDIFRCDSPGASASKSSCRHIILIAEDTQVRNELNRIKGLVKDYKIPVVELNIREINVFKYTYLGIRASGSSATNFLVESIKVIKENYNK